MATPHDRLPRLTANAACIAFAVAVSLGSSPATGDTIRIWRVGSPHNSETPRPTVPLSFVRESTRLGFRIAVEAFPATGFAATFSDAVARNAAPDLLVFDNFGVMNGITTALGHFEGIGQEPTFRHRFIKVTGALDELLGPARGWTYLFTLSPNHAAARTLALKKPQCPSGSSGPAPQGELADIVPKVATAYLEGDAIGVQAYSDPERLPAPRASQETIKVGELRACGAWGNDKLAVASVNASYEAETTMGHALVLLVLRRPSSNWQLLVAARDPISNGEFVKHVQGVGALLSTDAAVRALPIPATLLSPAAGDSPRPRTGQRFGTFQWRSGPSDDVVAEIAEFRYHDDARLFFTRPRRPGARGEISAGQLWTTGDEWHWRVWSVSRTGDIAFSEARPFRH
jgi:hypothetical protein